MHGSPYLRLGPQQIWDEPWTCTGVRSAHKPPESFPDSLKISTKDTQVSINAQSWFFTRYLISIVKANRSTLILTTSLLFVAILVMPKSVMFMETFPRRILVVMAVLKRFLNSHFQRKEFLRMLLINLFMTNSILMAGQT